MAAGECPHQRYNNLCMAFDVCKELHRLSASLKQAANGLQNNLLTSAAGSAARCCRLSKHISKTAGRCGLQTPAKGLHRIAAGCLQYSVTDDLDRRCLMSILRQFICSRVVRQECAALTASGTYTIPKDGDVSSYQDSIRALPR